MFWVNENENETETGGNSKFVCRNRTIFSIFRIYFHLK